MELSYECDRVWRDFEEADPFHRTCLECGHEVHNISAMTRGQARDFLRERATGGRLCIYMVRRGDDAIFTDDPRVRLAQQREGIKRLVLAAAVVSPLLIMGCEDSPEPRAEEVVMATPAEVGPGGVSSAAHTDPTPHAHRLDVPCALEPPALFKAKRAIERLFADLFEDEEEKMKTVDVEIAGVVF